MDIVERVERLYKIVHVPYAIISLISIFFGIVAYFAVKVLALSDHLLYWRVLPIGLVLIFFVWSGRRTQTLWRNRAARLKSKNPNIRTLDEVTRLKFVPGNRVEYGASVVIVAVKQPAESFIFSISWAGPRESIKILSQEGCNLEFRRDESSRWFAITCRFDREIPVGTEYSFELNLEFDNSQSLIRPYIQKFPPYLPERSLTQTLIFEDRAQFRFVEEEFENSENHKSRKTKFLVSPNSWHSFKPRKPVQGRSYKISIP